MAAPKLQSAIGNSASSTLGSGMASTDTSTPTLASSTNFQAASTPGEGMVLIDEGAATEELLYSTGISGGALTTPLANRGQEGGSAQTHAANAPIKGVMTAGMWNYLITSVKNVLVGSTGALDTTKVVDLTTAQALTNKDLSSGTNTLPGSNGWVSTAAGLTYTSTDGHTFVAATSIDLTGVVGLGDRFKVTNQAATQYFIVTAITSSAITLYGGSSYSITNTAITAPSYSYAKIPFGFNPDPSIWTETLRDVTDRSASPAASTWTNLNAALTLAIPIGIWRVFYSCVLQANTTTAPVIFATLSTATTTQSDADFTSVFSASAAASLNFTASKEKVLVLAVKTPYYLNAQYTGTVSILGMYGSTYAPTIIKAVSAYL